MTDSEFNTFDSGEDDNLLINLSEVEEQSFELLPKGKYPVVVEECEYQISKSSGKPMWSMRYSVTEGPYENRKLFQYISFSPKALPMSKANIAALAPELAELEAFNPKAIADEGTMTGRTAIAKVGIEKGQDGNDDRNNIKALFPVGGEADGDDAFATI